MRLFLKDTRDKEKTPLGDSILEAIALEKSQLSEIREMADLIIDTSSFTVHDLTRFFEEKFKGNVASKMSITIQSFGFKYGIPPDSDMVIDVRFLKNPHFVEELRGKTGLDKDVYEYVFSDERIYPFLKKLKSFGLPDT